MKSKDYLKEFIKNLFMYLNVCLTILLLQKYYPGVQKILKKTFFEFI